MLSAPQAIPGDDRVSFGVGSPLRLDPLAGEPQMLVEQI